MRYRTVLLACAAVALLAANHTIAEPAKAPVEKFQEAGKDWAAAWRFVEQHPLFDPGAD